MRASAMLEQFDFKAWEKALMALSALVFLTSMYLYLSDFPLRRYLFNIEDVGSHRQVGTIALKKGILRRQIIGESEFKSVNVQNPLYDEDTVVTGTDGSATLQLDDDSTIELAANTMVRLRFETNLNMGGISRAAAVDVVAGDVTGQARKTSIVIRSREKVVKIARETRQTVVAPKPEPVPVPVIVMPIATPAPVVIAVATPTPVPVPSVTPSPTPTVDPVAIAKLELISPKNGQRLSLERGTQVFKKAVSATWKVSPPDRRVLVSLSKLSEASNGQAAGREEIFHELMADVNGKGSANFELTAPGLYEWEVKGSKGEVIPGSRNTKAAVRLDPEFEGIEVLDPLVGGQVMSSNRLQGKQLTDFDITLRWKQYPGTKDYRVAVKSLATDKKPVLERTVSETQYVFNKDRVYNGQIFYQIFASLKNGFRARSLPSSFSFSFLAPSPVIPANHSVVAGAKLASEGNGVLLTWQKTNFTEFYELEISLDAKFKTPLQKQKLKENFYMLKAPKAGRYYWRVRGSSISVAGSNILSAPSDAFDFTVVRQ